MKSQHTPTPWHIKEGWDGHVFGPKDEMITRGTDCRTSSSKTNAEFIVRAVNSYEALLEFAKNNHETCADCEGTGKIYKHADPTSGQWVSCPIAEMIREAEGKK